MRTCTRSCICFSVLVLFILLFIKELTARKHRHEKLIDMSYPYDLNTVVWPENEPFGFISQNAGFLPPINNFYAHNDFKSAEHCGTHLDAPYHFNENGSKVGDIPIEKLITVGAFVNASLETNGNPNYTLPSSKLISWERQNGPFPENSVILVSFGWSSKYGTESYMGKGGVLSFPGLSREAAEWILKTRRVVGVGVDVPSVDQGDKSDVHILLHGSGLYHLENVNIYRPLPPLFTLIAMPMKIANGTGAPCRVVAIVK